MRRLTAAWLLAVMLLVPACSKAKGPAPKGDPPTSAVKAVPDGPVTLKVLDSGYSGAMDALVTAFYQENPNVRIEKVAPQSPTNGADVGAYYSDLLKDHKVDIIPGGLVGPHSVSVTQVLDLEPYVQKSRLDLNALLSDADNLRKDGTLYDLPYVIAPTVVLYNKAMFKAAGVPLPQAGWTWDRLRQTAAALTRGSGDGKVWGLAPYNALSLGEFYRAQEAPKDMVLSDAGFKEMLQLFGTMIETDGSVPPSAGDTDTSHVADFKNGRAAMTIDYMGSIRDAASIPFAWGMAPMPSKAGTKGKGYGWASSMAIAANTPFPDAAWAFLRFSVSPAGALALARAGYMPLNRTEEVRKAWLERNPPVPDGMVALLDIAWAPAPWSLEGRIRSEIYNAYTKAIRDTLSGAASWETAYDDYRRVVLTTH